MNVGSKTTLKSFSNPQAKDGSMLNGEDTSRQQTVRNPT
ncbi:MAG: hypothetical protein J07HX64_01695 [halophilic archaeon J07HX64]|nr:MAG: hypothetical protein J07HX64_01695 [halophilic archaeon J07HX64]